MRQIFKMTQGWLEKDRLPDAFIRIGIRGLLKEKLMVEAADGIEFGQERRMNMIHRLQAEPIAVATEKANEQHYEVPPPFYEQVLGPHLKYSCGYWREGVTDLGQAEADMLEITTERADLVDGQHILELGCGWGSLSLFMARKFPRSRIVGVSNSASQKAFIDARAAAEGIRNLEIITADMNDFDIRHVFDRVVSVEMFEHMRNYQRLLEKVAGFLNAGGRLFVHIFTHRTYPYFYEPEDEADWIAKYFFTGGIMPSDDLLLYFQDHLRIEHHWRVSGEHYAKTAEAWLANMDRNRKAIMPVLAATYGETEKRKWWVYWRVFFMACAELWGFRNGTEWMVSQYRFQKR